MSTFSNKFIIGTWLVVLAEILNCWYKSIIFNYLLQNVYNSNNRLSHRPGYIRYMVIRNVSSEDKLSLCRVFWTTKIVQIRVKCLCLSIMYLIDHRVKIGLSLLKWILCRTDPPFRDFFNRKSLKRTSLVLLMHVKVGEQQNSIMQLFGVRRLTFSLFKLPWLRV